jgi:hypothetical protein
MPIGHSGRLGRRRARLSAFVWFGGWQISGVTFVQSGEAFSVFRTTTTAPASATRFQSHTISSAIRRLMIRSSQRALASTSITGSTQLPSASRHAGRSGGKWGDHPRAWVPELGHRAHQDIPAEGSAPGPVQGGVLQLPESPESRLARHRRRLQRWLHQSHKRQLRTRQQQGRRAEHSAGSEGRVLRRRCGRQSRVGVHGLGAGIVCRRSGLDRSGLWTRRYCLP